MQFSDITNFLSNNVLIVLIALFFIGKAIFASAGKMAIEEHPDSKVVSITSDAMWKETTEEAFKSDKIVLVDFYATWCGPCRTAAPIYSKMSTGTV
jgi:thiol-disulfide isomerase/thioredoxin